ncbi:unnamed protein product [Protopolystoma xenopodis]|uniref:Uncharacterized protein n=1 Tax=Protopolystoma xenopodis TaxID=117903 RepID=A0A3S5AKN5_9PLAT|nr:unnamed protein product [Protopolystoma xenopodis]
MNSDGVFSPFLTISQDKHLNHITSCAGFDMSLGTASCHCKRKSTYNHNSDADELSSNGQSICSNFSNMGPSITWSSSSSSDEGSCDDPNDDFDIAPAPAKRVRTSRASHT